jgi:anti-sigma B factor antagonist
MDIAERVSGIVVILEPSGALTFADGQVALNERIRSLVDRGHRQVVINLAGVEYVDSAGLGELVNAQAILSKAGGRLRLAGATQRVRELLSVTRLLTVLQAFDTEAEAVRSLG